MYSQRALMISTNIKRNFKFDINSTENQGRFRINDPKIFKRMWTRHDPVHKGISYIVGMKQNGEFSTQSIRFNRSVWSEKKAAGWWKENKKKFVKYKTPAQTFKKPIQSRKRKNPTDPPIYKLQGKIYLTLSNNKYVSTIGEHPIFEEAVDIFMNSIKKLKIEHLPLIVLINKKEISHLDDYTQGFYNDGLNAIFIIDRGHNSDFIKELYHALLHELGHYYYRKVLSPKCNLYFTEYINKYFKYINLENIQKLISKYSIINIGEKFPLIGLLLQSLIEKEEDLDHVHDLARKFGKHYFQFTRPVSGYMPNNEEIFCEMFANYLERKNHPKLGYLKENYMVMENILNGKCDKV